MKSFRQLHSAQIYSTMSSKTGAAVSGTKILAAAAAATAIRYKQDDLVYDLGLLAASDSHPIDPVAFQKDPEAALLKAATENTQLLVKQIFELPVEMEEVGPVAMLPDRTTKLPRAKPVPKPKPLTRWEKFAQSKGITKTKRSRNVWDDEKKEWAPRYGYKRANDPSSEWAMEVRDGAPDTEDPFERAALEKSHRVVKNQINHVRNLQRATKKSDASTGMGDEIATADTTKAKKLVLDGYSAAGSSGGALVAPRIREASVDVAPKSKRARHDEEEHGAVAGKKKLSKKDLKASRSAPTVHTTAAGERLVVPVGVPQIAVAEGAVKGSEHKGRQKQSEGKHTKTERLKVVQRSTASLGKFDSGVKGEPDKPKDPKKMKRIPNETSFKDEAARNADVLRKLLGGTGEGERPSAGGSAVSFGAPTKSKHHSGQKRKR